MSKIGQTINGVTYLSEEQEFDAAYLRAREKEGRILSDEVVCVLPLLPPTHPHHREWELRKLTLYRVEEYLNEKGGDLKVLEVGCGNGWFSNWLLNFGASSVTGIDLNEEELEQAARCFKHGALRFYYADIFEATLPEAPFDLVIFNASVQYFPDFEKLVQRVYELLAPDGEIHLLDTKVYHEREVRMAQQRTMDYYRRLRVPEMVEYYHHRNYTEFEGHRWDMLYSPDAGFSVLKKLFRIKQSPFPWIRIRK